MAPQKHHKKKIKPKNAKSVKINNIIESNSFFSDDTILTIAVADAILNNKDYTESLKHWGKLYQSYLPDFKPYFKTTFSPGFEKWLNGDYVGTSFGNGAMMRISPVGFLFNTEEDVIKHAKLATVPSHNTENATKFVNI